MIGGDRRAEFAQIRQDLLKVWRESNPHRPGNEFPVFALSVDPELAWLGFSTVWDLLGFRLVEERLAGDRRAELRPALKEVAVCSCLVDKLEHPKAVRAVRNEALAHELGHLVLHVGKIPPEQAGAFEEREADVFSDVFLIPKRRLERQPEVIQMVRAMAGGEQLGNAYLWRLTISLAERFGVSGSTMARALGDLGFTIMDRRYRELALRYA